MISLLKKDCSYLLAIVFRDENKDGSISFEIDLPGGKRHLGETSFQCAIRETYEETSLLIDETWLLNDGVPLQLRGEGGECNVFYLVSPPTTDMLSSIEKDVFWKNTGLGKVDGRT